MLYTNTLDNPEFKQFHGKHVIYAVKSKEKKFTTVRDGLVIEYSGKFIPEQLDAFVTANQLGFLPELSQESYGALSKK